MRFHPRWAFLSFLLLAVEVLIALFVRDAFVRPYLGDVLVIPLIFFAVLTVADPPPRTLALGVLLFAFAVEGAQAAGLIRWLGWENNTMAKVILGNTFQWGDLLCYAVGAVSALLLQRALRQ